MVGWHQWLNGHELGVGDRQGGLACCSPWGHKELDMTEQLNQTELKESEVRPEDLWNHFLNSEDLGIKELRIVEAQIIKEHGLFKCL